MTPRARKMSPELGSAGLPPAELQSPKNREKPPRSPRHCYALLELFMKKTKC